MPGQLLRLSDRLLNTPLLIHPAKAQIILGVLSGRIGVEGNLFEVDDSAEGPDASRFVGSSRRADGSSSLSRTVDGTAIIPVLDTLVNRGAWLDSRSGLTSYEGIAAQLRAAGSDPDVHAVLLDISSPGGESAGMAGLADLVRSVRSSKPVTAFVNDMAASAAYGIASAASEIVISPTSIVGSIGVVMLHADRSGELAAQGVKPTLIFAGSHKVDGNPFEPLSDAVRSDLQASVDAHYRQFLNTVAAGRGGKLTADMARATEARTFIGAEAIGLGLADRIASFDEVLASLAEARSTPTTRPSGRNARKGGISMSTEERAAAEVASAAPAATLQPARTEAPAPQSAVRLEEAVAAARLEERARIRAIVNCEAAEGRRAQALVLATETSLTLPEAEKILSASPKESRIDALAQRAGAGPEFGATREPERPDPSARTHEGWKRAIANANRRFERA
ncbi:S49 family peptidase [Aestuariivirga sp.]|uniref:S49 family peptidase n=1 Tax=Aestuariivirga sp. TaxID=2650926 RepID=UPI003919BEC7